ncbi:GspH/FimT family pseudopilin [Congregibacter brevis]|uniref:Type II secretion system protein H n=1 Tax=Congregibacter brevis TaxID=3081201 RepID=A0ABZ0IBH7_9GAMM|nr:GspH/FimT family pseudopilin [Congregibacter sp. IMCC45268]
MRGSVRTDPMSAHRPGHRRSMCYWVNRDRSNGYRNASSGFTLIEVLLVLSMLAISLSLTAPPFKDRIEDLRSASAMRHLASLFALARHEALIRQRPVIVCALTAEQKCHRNWTANSNIAVFIDQNNDRRLDNSDQVLKELRWPLKGGEISWRASLARNYLQFESNGGTWQNGTLYYCPSSLDARKARALVISHSGRNYKTVDSNGDGIREDRSGRNLRC